MTGHEGREVEESYSSTLSLTLAPYGCVVSVILRPLYSRERDPLPIVYEAGWAPGSIWTGVEILAPTGIRSRTIQPVAIRSTDCTIPVHGNNAVC